MENKPGSGYTSPFGNEKGATTSDGPSDGAHDFLVDPASGAPKTGGRDFTQENREQEEGNSGYNPETVPDGGPLPFTKNDSTAESRDGTGTIVEAEKHKPFKLGGA